MSTSVLGPQWKQPQPKHYQPMLNAEPDWRIQQKQQYQNQAGARAVPRADWASY